MKQRLISIAAAALMVLALTPSAFAADVSTNGATVKGGDTITANGTYQVAASATGVIKINEGKTVTLQGSGTGAAANQELSIQCGKGVNLTLQDLCITNNSDLNILDFTGNGNVLKASGTNVLESIAYTPKAAIHVGPAAALSFQDGGGDLYLYKRTQGSGIGSDAEEANGAITFDGGRWFIKGTKTGAVIGNDTCGDADKEAQIGQITINGGELYVEANARGAAIGGSNMSRAGNVTITGGLVTIFNDYSASSIGAGQSMLATEGNNGTLTVTGGSLKLYLTRNGAAAWGTEMGLNDITLKAAKNNGSVPVYKYALDVSGASSPYTVEVDSKPYYSGGGHDYEFTPDTSSTTANWTKKSEDQQLYLYLPEGEHTVSVNGGTAQTITVEETEYATDVAVQIPEGSWADHAKIDWYKKDQTTFTLKTNEQLAGLASIVNSGQDTFEGKTVCLGADIDLSAYEWEPVGSRGESKTSNGGYAFQGTFDGADHEISGLYYYEFNNSSDSSDDYRGGLFAYASDAVFQNLTITSGYVSCATYAAGIVGEAPGCYFINCKNSADIFPLRKSDGGGWTLGNNSGGICGSGGVSFEKCTNYGKIEGNSDLAGICGNVPEGDVSVSNSQNYGDVTILWDGQAAGIVCASSMNTYLSVQNCENHGNITAQIGEAGGICGSRFSCAVLKGCINTGQIGGRNAGGMTGMIRTGTSQNPFVITNCYNTGKITSWTGYRYAGGAGGIVGSVSDVRRNVYITNCYSIGEISCDPTANINGEKFASGILGAYFYYLGGGDDYPILYDSAVRKSEWLYLSKYKEKSTDLFVILKNNYYLKGSAPGGICGEDVSGETNGLTSKNLKTIASTLGNAYMSASSKENNGYPVLKWQKGIADNEENHYFTVSSSANNAVVQVTDKKGSAVKPVSQGKYLAEPGNVYLYKTEASGYLPEQGIICNLSEDTEIKTDLSVNDIAKKIVLDTDAKDAVLKVSILDQPYGMDYKSSVQYQYQTATKNDEGNYELFPTKKYKYTVTASGYEDVTGEFTAGNDDVVIKAFKDESKLGLGDVNGDSKITMKDLDYLAHYLVKPKKYPLSEAQALAADINQDGKITMKDLDYLAKHLVKPNSYPL